MTRIKSLLLGGFLCTWFAGCEKDQTPTITNPDAPASKISTLGPGAQPIANQYIIELTDDFSSKALKSVSDPAIMKQVLGKEIESLLSTKGIGNAELGAVYTEVFQGFAVKLKDASQVAALENMSAVAHIEPDQLFSVVQVKETDPAYSKAQSISYGTLRVGSANGYGRRAWIVDTGIDLDHPDLNVNASLSKSFVSTTSLLGVILNTSPEDGNGHGTHCAGIVAAKNNSFGTKGVAYNAEVVAIKVLGDNGSGSTSGIIAGLDYIASKAKPGEVVNMSLGGGISSSLDNAVLRTASKGILFAIAAGNSKTSATNTSPARVNGPNIYTVSAMGTQDYWAYYSNYGNPPVDYCAPGSSIYSTYKNGSYATLSGTSMATPHVSGILLLRGKPAVSGRVKNDPDGNADYIAHL